MSPDLMVRIAVFVALLFGCSGVRAAGAKTFAAFNTGTLTGGGAAFTKSLDVSGLSGSDYLFVQVQATFVPNPDDAHSAWSQTIVMQLDDGGSTIHWLEQGATSGALASSASTTMYWTGILPTKYVGGNALVAKFRDTFTDASGPYTSSLNNVTITILPAPAPAHGFAAFNSVWPETDSLDSCGRRRGI